MAVERGQLGQPFAAPLPTFGRPLARPPAPPSMPPMMPPGAPPAAPGGAGMPPLPDPRVAQREAIIEALGGPQVVPGSDLRSPDGPSTQPRPYSPQDTTRRGKVS